MIVAIEDSMKKKIANAMNSDTQNAPTNTYVSGELLVYCCAALLYDV